MSSLPVKLFLWKIQLRFTLLLFHLEATDEGKLLKLVDYSVQRTSNTIPFSVRRGLIISNNYNKLILINTKFFFHHTAEHNFRSFSS